MSHFYVEKMKSRDLKEVVELLETNQLQLQDHLDYTAVLKEDGKLIGTCSHKNNVLKSFALLPCYQAGGRATHLLTHMINHLFDRGYHTLMAYSKSVNRAIFESMHFRCIYDTGDVALMLHGIDSLEAYIKELQKEVARDTKKISGIVMNANPFTKGHQYLVEKAAKESDLLLVFVVEEDVSDFSFKDRFKMVVLGTDHLKNVKVLKGGDFMVSMATFPNYFIRDASEHARYSAELDAGIFASLIAPRLGIKKRYVGTEPFSPMTQIYNESLKKILNKYEVKLELVDRLEVENQAISASEVRKHLNIGGWRQVEKMLPKTTYDYLKNKLNYRYLKEQL